ncbi:peptide chain release factor-like protein [Paraburkholderia sp. EG287A]|uniref:peptide chain release factor-like protein n=1 Tax=Paraburkholderia sp. EG287A TaxID=3237012 RepID=UPI0034D3364F
MRRQPSRPGAIFDVLILEGDAAALTPLLQEAGGHRWQRVPPTERRGRVQSSSITVAVFEGSAPATRELREEDVCIRFTKGTGPGGQNRNRRFTACVCRDSVTGLEVKAEVERTQEANRRVAMTTLRERVREHYAGAAHQSVNEHRRAQAGLGERGDKIRTYRADGVTDHRTGRKAPLQQIQAGRLELLA